MIALFFDTETTGFKHGDFIPEVVQMGALLQDTDTLRVLAEINLICQVQNEIPENVAAIHGITTEMSKAYGVPQEVAESMFGLMAMYADQIVAHNLAFDMGILNDRWKVAHAVLAGKTQFCTMRKGTEVIKLPKGRYHGEDFETYKPPKLIEAYRHFFGKDFENAHDAMADVRACRDVYFKLRESL